MREDSIYTSKHNKFLDLILEIKAWLSRFKNKLYCEIENKMKKRRDSACFWKVINSAGRLFLLKSFDLTLQNNPEVYLEEQIYENKNKKSKGLVPPDIRSYHKIAISKAV